MRFRHKSVGDGADPGHTCPSQPEIAALSLSSRQETLDYIAAMVLELKMMSAQADHRALTGLLHMAYQEALQRRRAGR